MRIGADNNFTGPNMPLLRQQCMAYPGPSELVIIFYFVPFSPAVQPFVKLRAFNVFGRLKMIRRHNDFFRVENLIDTLLFQHRNRRRCRHVVAHHNIYLRVHKITRHDFLFTSRPC